MRSVTHLLRLQPSSKLQKWIICAAIALATASVALLATVAPPFNRSLGKIDDALYDTFYKSRKPQSKRDSDIVMVVVDDKSVREMIADPQWHFRWPWPREFWGAIVQFLERSGAKVVVFDVYFDEPSFYSPNADPHQPSGDDGVFAQKLNDVTIPVVHARRSDVSPPPFAPPVSNPPIFGAVDIDSAMIRSYAPYRNGVPSLAVQAVKQFGKPLPAWTNEPFRLHFYGPNEQPDGTRTFRYLSAYSIFQACLPGADFDSLGITPDLFNGKIVVIGAIADAATDIKSSPLDELFPAVESHATAIANILDDRRVHPVSQPITFSIGLAGALLASAGALFPKRAWFKLPLATAVIAAIYILGFQLFTRGRTIYWLPLAMPLSATIAATVLGLAWTYLVEDRQRRVLLRFLAQYVSPEVAAELDRQGTISLGGVRREMTVMFTDIAGFTDVSEQMEVEQLEKFMNFYLSEMSGIVFAENGTLDKYIGDAIMSFWNAPLNQPDHAVHACRTALGIKQRERALQSQLEQVGAKGILTRIGINTGQMVVGNMGSLQKLNYTVMGDAVNLASRLEGANKLYGSQILVAQPTVDQVKDRFVFRQLDLLRVKGKKKPMAVYELLAEGNGDEKLHRVATDFGRAFALYQQKKWDESEQTLIALLAEFPDDGPAQALLKRVQSYRQSPPPADWDGVHVAKEK